MDSQTNFTGCIPIQAKSQFDLMVREILQFTQSLGHSECVYLCNNEPSIRQVQQRAIRARLALGLATRGKTPAAYSHGNENTVQRVRSLAGSLMYIPCPGKTFTGIEYEQQHMVMCNASCKLAFEQVCSGTWMHTI